MPFLTRVSLLPRLNRESVKQLCKPPQYGASSHKIRNRKKAYFQKLPNIFNLVYCVYSSLAKTDSVTF